MRPLLLLFVNLALLGGSTPAWADDDDAGTLLRRGVELRREHRNQEALETFEHALAMSPTPTARAQVAMAEQALGRWGDAERDLDAALDAADDPWIAKSRAVLEEARAEIERHLSWLTVDVDVAGADVQIDGRPVLVGSEERVVSGVAVLEVRAIGYVPDIRRVDLPPAAHARIAIALAPLVARMPSIPERPVVTPATADAVPTARRSALPVATPVLAVSGLASIAVGSYFGVRTFTEKRARDAQCSMGPCTPVALADDADARLSAGLATVAIGAGVASLAAGAVWWILDSHRARESDARSRDPRGPTLLAGVGLAGVGVGVYFGVLALGQRDQRDAQCPRGECTPAALAYDAEARRSASVSTVALGAGLGCLAAGAVWWMSSREPTRPPAAKWRAGPMVDTRTWGVLVEGGIE